MKRKIKYTDGPLRKARVVEDFLPAAKDLVLCHKKSLTVKRKIRRSTKSHVA